MLNNKPQVVLFQDDEIALNHTYKQTFSLRKDTAIKSIEYDFEDFKKQNTLITNERPSSGTLFLLHPFKDNVYVNQSTAEDYLLREKLELYKRAAQLLGARKITSKVIYIGSEKISISIDGDVTYEVVNVGGTYDKKEETKYKNSLEKSFNFETQENFDIKKNIDELREYIDKYGLHYEHDLCSLIDSRDSSESGTLLTKQTVKSEMSQEYNSLLEISAKINSPVFKLSGAFKKSVEKANILRVEFEFIF